MKSSGVSSWLDNYLWGKAERDRFSEAVRTLAVSVWKFLDDGGPLRASALTFTTVLSLVPFLAIMFAILKGMGVQKRLEPLILENLAGGNQEVVSRIIQYVDNTNVGTLGALGMVALFFTALSVLSNIEQSFNVIWGVQRGRTIIRKVTDYLSLMIVGPVLLLVSTSLSTTTHLQRVLGEGGLAETAMPLVFLLIPFLTKALAFSASYVIMPNKRVGFKAATLGGLVAAFCWQWAEWGYINFQIGVARYNAIYGALAQLPVFLVWVYVGWCIVLVGAEIACVLELPGKGRFLRGGGELWMPRLRAAFPILMEVGRRFENGEPAPTAEELVCGLGLHQVEGHRVVRVLTDAGLLVTTEESPPTLVPARSPERTSVAEMIRRVANSQDDEGGELEPSETRIMNQLVEGFGEATWAEWALSQPSQLHSIEEKQAEEKQGENTNA